MKWAGTGRGGSGVAWGSWPWRWQARSGWPVWSRSPPARRAAPAPAPAPTLVPVGARVPILVDTTPPGASLVMPEPSLRASSLAASASTTTIDVTYTGFTTPARTAFQYAVDLWKPLISSSVPIKVNANWSTLATNILGQAGPEVVLRDRPGLVPKSWYPVALANAITGTDLYPGGPDIAATFNQSYPSWYFGIDGHPPAGQIDFVSVVMHELGHGLGFIGLADISGGVGTLGLAGYPGIYDRFTKVSGTPVLNFANPSSALGLALQGTGLRFNGTQTNAANAGSGARLYAPPLWNSGSSYSHLDESVFPPGNANSLMTPSIGDEEAIHDPGPVTLGIFRDMGWNAAAPVPPAAPTAVIASPMNGAAQVAFTPGAGSPAGTTYSVLSTPAGGTGSGTTSPITVNGLTNGAPYTFTVTATNTAGTSPASVASNAVTPLAPPTDLPTIMAPTDGASDERGGGDHRIDAGPRSPLRTRRHLARPGGRGQRRGRIQAMAVDDCRERAAHHRCTRVRECRQLVVCRLQRPGHRDRRQRGARPDPAHCRTASRAGRSR